MGQTLMDALVNQRLGSMAIPLNLLATLKWHRAIYTERDICGEEINELTGAFAKMANWLEGPEIQ